VLARDLDTPVLAMSQLAGGRAAPRDAADPVRPPRVRRDRAGRRPRLLHLPRRVLQRGVGPAGPGRGHLREAPQRADRLREAVVHEALREVRRPRGIGRAPEEGLRPTQPRLTILIGSLAEPLTLEMTTATAGASVTLIRRACDSHRRRAVG
jgi:hypothetical protein